MAFKEKNIRIGDKLTIPILQVALVSAFCLWNAALFIWILPADGMILNPNDGIITEDYPHILNAVVYGIVWGLSTSSFLVPTIRHVTITLALVILHNIGVLCVGIFAYHTTVNAVCSLPICV